VAETLPAEVLTKMHAPAKPADVPVIDPHVIDKVRVEGGLLGGWLAGWPVAGSSKRVHRV